MSESRKRAYRKGHRAEWLAALALTLKGYCILARRYKTPVGEIDLIARKGDLVAFIEVKARNSKAASLDSVSYASQKRISSAGEWWLTRQKKTGALSWRFDVVAVLPWKWPIHIEDVW